ncbi:MAG: radical SAM protein [Bacteroides sp.]|nr:radical SAM protein [Roseburia sp.]MCM1346111.1 radical SAM protein [Bacteroides sp.]MCM1421195.1 radical SAM protein [Bacteroides sp.]
MTVIYPSPIFGPIHSRRLGVSLGINLLPGDGKCCSFDCLYCECGFNRERVPHSPMPSRESVCHALETRLADMGLHGPTPDVLTFAGNGEPTMHPAFPEIIEDTIRLRDKYFPEAKVSVLSNATQIMKPRVFDALKKVDNNILKLDTVSDAYIRMVDRPHGTYNVDALVEQMRCFGGDCIVQTMFMNGEYEGQSVSNTSDEFVNPWIEAVKLIAPREVMIYTIDRETPAQTLRKASHEELDRIAARLVAEGIKCQVSY